MSGCPKLSLVRGVKQRRIDESISANSTYRATAAWPAGRIDPDQDSWVLPDSREECGVNRQYIDNQTRRQMPPPPRQIVEKSSSAPGGHFA
jgi:hypothetical protein